MGEPWALGKGAKSGEVSWIGDLALTYDDPESPQQVEAPE